MTSRYVKSGEPAFGSGSRGVLSWVEQYLIVYQSGLQLVSQFPYSCEPI